MSSPSHITKGSVLVDLLSPEALAEALMGAKDKNRVLEAQLKVAVKALKEAAEAFYTEPCGCCHRIAKGKENVNARKALAEIDRIAKEGLGE